MDSSTATPLELDNAHRILGRVRSISVRHEALLAGFWNPTKCSFGLEGPATSGKHVTSTCTCLLSFLDAGIILPSFIDSDARGKLTQWLLTTPWESAKLKKDNLYTTPIALATLLTLDPRQVNEVRVEEAIKSLVNAALDIDPAGPICFEDHPPSAFLTYWTLRALIAAISVQTTETTKVPRQRVNLAIQLATEWIDGELHRQFSYYSISDLDRFNVLELAYLLAALDLSRREYDTPFDPQIMARGLDLIFQAQLSNGLWPRGAPIFLHPSIGHVYPFCI